jgi:uncharacterized phage-associated protein
MPFESKAIANYLLDLARAKGSSLTPMKLQKLAFFSHGWHLALTDSPLIIGGVQAWKYGPVITSLYATFREFGNQAIPCKAQDIRFVPGPKGEAKLEPYEPSIDTDVGQGDKELAKAIINRVYEVYGKYEGLQLSDMTHREGTPWWTVRKEYQGEMPRGLKIPDEMIISFFKKQLQKQPTAK